MTVLHIEHDISDLGVWRTAFDRFADARRGAGVRREEIWQPLGRADYVVVHLTFDDAHAAAAFAEFLVSAVWSVPANAPALVGRPQTLILEPAQ